MRTNICCNCYGRMAAQACCETACFICGKKIFNGTTPGDKLCGICAEQTGLCRHCGKPVEEERRISE